MASTALGARNFRDLWIVACPLFSSFSTCHCRPGQEEEEEREKNEFSLQNKGNGDVFLLSDSAGKLENERSIFPRFISATIFHPSQILKFFPSLLKFLRILLLWYMYMQRTGRKICNTSPEWKHSASFPGYNNHFCPRQWDLEFSSHSRHPPPPGEARNGREGWRKEEEEEALYSM